MWSLLFNGLNIGYKSIRLETFKMNQKKKEFKSKMKNTKTKQSFEYIYLYICKYNRKLNESFCLDVFPHES